MKIPINELSLFFPCHNEAENLDALVAEALSAGRPVLSTRCGGPEDQIEDDVSGWLVKPNDPAALSARISQLVANSLLVEAAALNCMVTKSYCQFLDEMEQIYDVH